MPTFTSVRVCAECRQIDLFLRLGVNGRRDRGVARNGRPQLGDAPPLHLLNAHQAAVNENPPHQEGSGKVTSQKRGGGEIKPPHELAGRVVVARHDKKRKERGGADPEGATTSLQTHDPIVVAVRQDLTHQLRIRPQHAEMKDGNRHEPGDHQHAFEALRYWSWSDEYSNSVTNVIGSPTIISHRASLAKARTTS